MSLQTWSEKTVYFCCISLQFDSKLGVNEVENKLFFTPSLEWKRSIKQKTQFSLQRLGARFPRILILSLVNFHDELFRHFRTLFHQFIKTITDIMTSFINKLASYCIFNPVTSKFWNFEKKIFFAWPYFLGTWDEKSTKKIFFLLLYIWGYFWKTPPLRGPRAKHILFRGWQKIRLCPSIGPGSLILAPQTVFSNLDA